MMTVGAIPRRCQRLANLSTIALDGMDQENSKELEKDKQKMHQVTARQQAKRYMRSKLRQSIATGSGAKRQGSNMKWARQYLPSDTPPGITECTLNRPPNRGNWVARYD